MTITERQQYLKKGFVILRARRNPKLDNWHVSYFVNPNFHRYSLPEFKNREQCELHINEMVSLNPTKFIADFSKQ